MRRSLGWAPVEIKTPRCGGNMIVLYSFFSALLMAGFSMSIKVLLRYRLCDAGYVKSASISLPASRSGGITVCSGDNPSEARLHLHT
jgi:hypothetical protein